MAWIKRLFRRPSRWLVVVQSANTALALRQSPPGWLVASRPVNTYVMAAAPCVAAGSVYGLGELVGLWGAWLSPWVYIAYGILVVRSHRAGAGEQLWRALGYQLSRQHALELPWRWPLSVATAVVLPGYVVVAAAIAVAAIAVGIAGVVLAAYVFVYAVYIVVAAWPYILIGWFFFWLVGGHGDDDDED